MRSSLSTAGRSALVFGAATLVGLTAVCGPGDLLPLGSSTDLPAATAAGPALVPGESQQLRSAPAQQNPVPTSVPPVEEPVATPVPPVVTPTAPAVESESDEPVRRTQEERARTHTKAKEQRPRHSSSESGGRSSSGNQSAGGSATRVPAAPAPAAPAAPAPAAPAAPGPASGGSGGSYADQPRTSFTAANGQTGQYLRYAGGIDPARATGLVVYADGTGEYGVDNPTSSYALGGSSGLVAAAKARNMITLAVESPNQSCECWHTGDTAAYADFLADLIEKQFAAYPIGEVWLVGFSSGAQEITRFLVPRHPELMRVGGGWVVFGGGGPPAGGGSAVTAASMGGVRGHWYTGTADTAVPLTASWGARAGESWYAARGVQVTSEYPSGVGHGLDGKLGSTVARMIDAG